LWCSEDEHITLEVAVGERTGDGVPVSSCNSWKNGLRIQGDIEVDKLATSVWCAPGRAAINHQRTVAASLVADFTKEVINNSITASWELAVGTAGIGTVSIQRTIITLLSGVNDTITASWELAIVSAAAWESVTVACSIVANFSWVKAAVSALELAGRGAFVTINLVSIVACLASVNNTISAPWNFAVGSASIGGVSILSTCITLLRRIEDAITTEGLAAACSASVGGLIVVASSIIAFLTSVEDSISALDFASGAPHSVDGTFVALFSSINDIITASGGGAVGSASIWHHIGISGSLVAQFTSFQDSVSTQFAAISVTTDTSITFLTKRGINDQISTNRDGAVGSASIRAGVGVQQT